MPKHVQEFDYIVVGGGVIGASVFYHLARYGFTVCLLEKNTVVSGCTMWSGGIVRCFHLNKDLCDKAVFSWDYYTRFEEATSVACPFIKTGFLYFPEEKDIAFAVSESSRLSKQIPIEWLDADRLHNKFGTILIDKSHGAVYEPLSGYMDPVRVTHSWLEAAKAKSGVLYEHVDITKYNFSNPEICSLETSIGHLYARRVILATGYSTPALLDQLNIKHDLYAQLIHVDVRRPAAFPEELPAYIDDCYQLNGRPDAPSGKIYLGHPTHLRLDGSPSWAKTDKDHSEKIKQQGTNRWNWVSTSECVASLRSPDCYTKEGTGRVMAVDEAQRIFVATGFSGGGFKMAPWVGSDILRQIKALDT
ncbi:MAG: FAD-dependent oxidoreductase [Legionellaceae bacterium]|nr:FAD-dependent oxidoreductase [Legionellaceae bacterium]